MRCFLFISVLAAAATAVSAQSLSYSYQTIAPGLPAAVTTVARDNSSGLLYVLVGNAVEAIPSSGAPVLIAGSVTAAGSADGIGAAALFKGPKGLAADGAGNLFVADSGNNAIRKIALASDTVTTVAGLTQGSANGQGVSAQFNNPTAIAVDASDNVYVIDQGNNAVRKVDAAGNTSTPLTAAGLDFVPGLTPFPSDYTLAGIGVDGSGVPYVTVQVSIPFADGDFPGLEMGLLKLNTPSGYTVLATTHAGTGVDSIGFLPADGTLAVAADGTAYFSLSYGVESVAPGSSVASSVDWSASWGVPTAVDSEGNLYGPSGNGYFIATLLGVAPSISAQPASSVSITYGQSTTLSISASGTPAPTYQWQVDGTSIADATNSTFTTSQAGDYSVVVTNSAGSSTSTASAVTTTSRLVNVSTRALVSDGNSATAGFVVQGWPGETESVLIRGVGPALTPFGISQPLAQPTLTLFDSNGSILAINSGWNANANAAQIVAAESATGAFALPLNSPDAALLINLPPGAYTAEVSGPPGTSGIALAEVYEVAAGEPQVINLSTRAFASSGVNAEIAGFSVTGSAPATVLIRAAGPSLAEFGVTGFLAQPTLSVVNSSGATVASNTGWSTASNATEIAAAFQSTGAFPFPAGSADSALLLTLSPGTYTAVVTGVGNTSGQALVEVYQAP